MSTCFHCGLPVPAAAGFGFAAHGEWRAFCCAGCEAVSRAISGLGLDDYYRLRSAPATRPEGQPAEDLAAFDRPEEQARFVTFADGIAEAPLLLEGLRCAACAWLIEEGLRRLPGVASLEVNFATRRAWLRWDPREVALSRVLQAVRDLGCGAWPYEEGRVALVEAHERKTLLRRFWIAGLGMMQVMMYAVPTYMAGDGEIGADAEALMRWAGLVLTLPVMFYSALPFFTGAWHDLRQRRLGMDTPIALGLGVAFAASVLATVNSHGAVYFDSVTMFVFLLTGSRYLECLARGRAAESLQHLARAVPRGPALRIGDRVTVPAGAAVPADGCVEGDDALVSEAWLTGESRPLRRSRGELVLAGSVNLGSVFTLRATRVGGATALSSIQRMMERALAERPRWVVAAERASSWFVALVLFAAAMALVAWWPTDPARATWIAVSVLIVTCPCAFALAMPAALTVATGRLARGNVAVTRAHALEALAAATDIVFDKTGTLTYGRPVLREVRSFEGNDEARARAIAATMARDSNHPLDRALAVASESTLACESHESFAGQGLQARVDGRLTRLGRRSWVAELIAHDGPAWPDAADTLVWLGDQRGWIAAFRLGDALRGDAAPAVAVLEAMGLRVHLLSGDEPAAVDRVAQELGIASATARALPETKQRYVRNLQLRDAKVAMVGDGINDAPVLAQADVSIAMGGGADLAQLRADAVLLSDSLQDLVAAVRIARRTRAVVRENLGWALAYNAIAIPLAFAGLVTPLTASIGMSASSLAVVANALRLRR